MKREKELTKEKEYSSDHWIIQHLWTLTKSLVIVLLLIVVSYKIIITPLGFKIDFIALLSMILALFSVGLAALFYFKATETSNNFYDNTFKFTKELAELLTRIESGFGERLKHLDESYTGIINKLGPYTPKETETLKKEKEEEKELEKERNDLIEKLAKKARLQEKEKKEFITELNKKNKALMSASQEIASLRRKFFISTDEKGENLPDHLLEYIRTDLLNTMNRDFVRHAPGSMINNRFRRHIDNLPPVFIQDLKHFNLINEDREITPRFLMILRRLAREA